MPIGDLNPLQPSARAAQVTNAIVPRPVEVRPTSLDVFERAVAPSGDLSKAAESTARLTRASMPFRAQLSAWLLPILEQTVEFFSLDHWKGHRISIATSGAAGRDLSFVVGPRLGAGFWGTVHRIRLTSANDEAKAALPQLFEAGAPRDDLVIKFPRRLPIPDLKGLNPWRAALLAELDFVSKIMAVDGSNPFVGAEIMFASRTGGNTRSPFLIKQFLKATSIESLAKGAVRLSSQQVDSLRRDIFEPAARLARSNLFVDIRPENVAWDASEGRFVMYEVSPMGSSLLKHLVTSPFEVYLGAYEVAMQRHHRHHRLESVHDAFSSL